MTCSGPSILWFYRFSSKVVVFNFVPWNEKKIKMKRYCYSHIITLGSACSAFSFCLWNHKQALSGVAMTPLFLISVNIGLLLTWCTHQDVFVKHHISNGAIWGHQGKVTKAENIDSISECLTQGICTESTNVVPSPDQVTDKVAIRTSLGPLCHAS